MFDLFYIMFIIYGYFEICYNAHNPSMRIDLRSTVHYAVGNTTGLRLHRSISGNCVHSLMSVNI